MKYSKILAAALSLPLIFAAAAEVDAAGNKNIRRIFDFCKLDYVLSSCERIELSSGDVIKVPKKYRAHGEFLQLYVRSLEDYPLPEQGPRVPVADPHLFVG